MLTLYNPLDKFQSYSIHHILLATRTTQAAKDFTDEGKNGPTLAAINSTMNLGDAVPYGDSNTAFLVIDTRRFSQFSIESVKYDVLINGLDRGAGVANLATSMEMTVQDSIGISFINFLQWLMNDQMQTNFDGMIFMHRVVFVGHTSAGKTETVQSVTIPLYLFNLELNLDSSKGMYNIEFMPNMNFDVVKHDRWLNIYTASRFFTGPGQNTLGAMVENFELQLNNASQDYYNKAQVAVQSGGQTKDKFGRVVKYQITIPKTWETFPFIGAATANATETVFAKTLKARESSATQKVPPKSPTPVDTHLSVEPGITITEVLDIMFNQVREIADLGAGRKTTNSVVFYKHMVGITSDDDSVVVHVDVVQFEVPNVTPQTGVNNSTDAFYTVLEDGSRVPKDYMEFDYIFTGKNKDIMHFDMKMQNLTWFLASNLNVGATSINGDNQQTDGVRDVSTEKHSEQVKSRPYDALLLPRNTADELKNFANYTSLTSVRKDKEAITSSQDYTRNLSQYYAMSPITCQLTIRGNPLIMAKFNQNSFLEHMTATPSTTNTSTPSNKAQYRANLEAKILSDNTHPDEAGNTIQEIQRDGEVFRVVNTLGTANYAKSPVFVKVNIKGPRVDPLTGKQIDSTYAEDVLTNNFYTVFRVTNKIEGNSFTQDLELYSHSIFGMDNKLSPPATRNPIKGA